MDEESWYSVTPEPLAKQIAEEVAACNVDVIVDGFCGAGGNAIGLSLSMDLSCLNSQIVAFAKYATLVYAWDIDPVKIEVRMLLTHDLKQELTRKCARHNAKLYGVADNIHFQVGDFFDLIKTVKTDCVFISPPWVLHNHKTMKTCS